MYGEDYRRPIANFAENLIAKRPVPEHRQISKGHRAYKGQTTWVKGIWLGRAGTTRLRSTL